MKHSIPMTLALLAAGAVLAAEPAPTNQVADAIAKLKAANNYSWTSTLKMANSDFNIGPVKGQADKDGFAKMSQSFNDNTTEIVLKGDKVAFKGENGWELIGEGGDMSTFFAASMARNGAAAQEAGIVLKSVKEVKALDGGALGGDFTSEGATDLMSFGPRRTGGENAFPAPKNAKGSVKFWLKDGMLTKFETHLIGTIAFGDNENQMDQTRTVEIQDVGTTKMDIPADAKKKLEAPPAASPK
ncbi:MAG TPA: hypothetical protein VN765_06475 [Candidatus Acidoferrum sp.]|nr:hypothetical protein [Candidatus Acidoferrum sp.]